jgi:hypothetical protein
VVEVWVVADDLKDAILSIFEASLDAQLRAVRRLRQAPVPTPRAPRSKGMSQVDMAYDILKRAPSPLHVSLIIERIEQAFGVGVERESLVSALSKKVARRDRFARTAKNTFALLAQAR